MASGSVSEPKEVANLIELGTKLALLVGINNYDDSSINRLNFSVRDIQDFHNVLVDPERGKYEDNNVRVLSDANAEKPTRSNILSKLATLARSAKSEDSILVYFSGHGAEIGGKPCLLCSDTFRNTIDQTALSNELIKKTMESSQARVKIVILDACHSGVLKGIKDSGLMTKSFFESFFPPPEGFVVLSSCKLGEVSHEWAEKEHGVFSYYLLEGLNGSADKDEDGIVTVTDAHKYTSENVKRWAFQKGLEQSPTLDATISGDIPLVHVTKAAEKEELFDKSIIVRIVLKTFELEQSEIQEMQENLCGSMLRFFKPSEIEKTSAADYRFPYGTITSDWQYIEGERVNFVAVSFEYEKENWDKIDEMISHFDKGIYWNSILYLLGKEMNMEQIVQKCKESAFEIISFRPEKGQELIVVYTKAWLDTNTDFHNLQGGGGSYIRVFKTRADYNLPANLYSTLSPENMLEFVRSCLE